MNEAESCLEGVKSCSSLDVMICQVDIISSTAAGVRFLKALCTP